MPLEQNPRGLLVHDSPTGEAGQAWSSNFAKLRVSHDEVSSVADMTALDARLGDEVLLSIPGQETVVKRLIGTDTSPVPWPEPHNDNNAYPKTIQFTHPTLGVVNIASNPFWGQYNSDDHPVWVISLETSDFDDPAARTSVPLLIDHNDDWQIYGAATFDCSSYPPVLTNAGNLQANTGIDPALIVWQAQPQFAGAAVEANWRTVPTTNAEDELVGPLIGRTWTNATAGGIVLAAGEFGVNTETNTPYFGDGLTSPGRIFGGR